MASIASAPVEEGLHQPSVEERKALIERIAASNHFRRSARLRDFLLYVGIHSLRSGSPDIHEHEIGIKVFGRDRAYDRSQDNIVRVNATELRKRIELYFASEGADEPLYLEIPRGSYKPVFRRRTFETKIRPADTGNTFPHSPSLPDNVPSVAASFSLKRIQIVWAMITLTLAAACVLLALRLRTVQKTISVGEGKPAITAFWADFIHGSRETDIVLPDASVSLSEEILGQPISLRDYANHNYMRQLDSLQIGPDRKRDLGLLFDHNLVAFGDFQAAQEIMSLAPSPSSLHLTLSRLYDTESIKRDNLILIGGKKANPWVRLFDDQMNFSLDYDSGHSQLVVGNRHPVGSELAIYSRPADPHSFTGYSVIAYLPSPSHTGNVIIIEGTDSDATSAAAAFLTSEDQLEQFSKAVHSKKLPYFELVLKTSRISGTSLNSQTVAYRTHPDMH